MIEKERVIIRTRTVSWLYNLLGPFHEVEKYRRLFTQPPISKDSEWFLQVAWRRMVENLENGKK